MKNILLGTVTTLGLGIAALSSSGAPGTVTPVPPPADLALGREIFKELIEINSTHSRGSTEVARAIEQRLLGAGYAATDVVFIAPPDHPTKGNLVIRVHGTGTGRAALFLGHLDVVEAKPEDWSVDPFKLTDKDGYFYGRGTIDMKDGDATLVESLIRLKREGFRPKRDVIVAFTADEEAGGDANGPAFLLKEHRDLIDASLVLNLDGGGGMERNGKPLYVEVGTSEKTYVTYTVETTSAGGHGSLPGPDNAIYRLAAGLGRLEAFKFPVMTTATTRASFAALADILQGPDAADMRAVAATSPDLAAAERLSRDPYFNAQLRTTCVATLISGGHAENALPQRARATIQCRMMPGDTAEHVHSLLTTTFTDPKISVTLDAAPILSPESPPTAAILGLSAKVVHSMWPGLPIVPTMATGFSDDRRTRAVGIPSYDMNAQFSELGENRAHGRDERAGVHEFDESVEYVYRLIKAVAAIP